MTTQDAWRYNLPGFGMVRVRLFPHALHVYEFLEGYGHVEHLKTLDQLGPIRQVLPGAHHTRYEYLMAQWAIITELCHLRGPLPTGLSLGSPRKEFGSIPSITGQPSNGEVLMVLALLGNVGHLPSTFSGERAFLKYLRGNASVRGAFRNGLPKEDRARFNTLVQNDNLYQFNYYIAAFLLERYRRRRDGHAVADFCQAILRSFICLREEDGDRSLFALWSLYRSIRRLTYLALDSHYSPVPFSLDLAPIFFSLENLLSDVFLEASAFQEALKRFEDVLRDTVYMGPDQMINHSRVSDKVLKRLEESAEPDSIGQLWELLGPGRADNAVFKAPSLSTAHGTEWGSSVQLAYDLDSALAPILLPDPIGWERSARAASGLRSCMFASDFDPPRRHIKITAALAKGIEPLTAQKAVHRIAKQLIDFETSISDADVTLSASSRTRNGLTLLRFLLPIVFGQNRRVRFRTLPAVEQSPVFRTTGSTRAANLVKEYWTWARNSSLLGPDELREIETLEQTLRDIDYRGTLIAFAGATDVIEDDRVVMEVDGLALLLSRDLSKGSLILVEAKNFTSGSTAAKKQLTKRLVELGIPASRINLKKLPKRGAYAEVVTSDFLKPGV